MSDTPPTGVPLQSSQGLRIGDVLEVVEEHHNHLPLGRRVRLVCHGPDHPGGSDYIGTDAVSELFKPQRFAFVERPAPATWGRNGWSDE